MSVDVNKKPAWFETASQCRFSNLPVVNPKMFVSRHPGSNYFVDIAKLGDRILLVKASGYVRSFEMTEAMMFMDDYVSKHYDIGTNIFLIEDYAEIEGCDAEARKIYIKHHKESESFFGGVIYNLPVLFRISFNIAQRLHIQNQHMYAVDSYKQAIDLALKIIDRNVSLLNMSNTSDLKGLPEKKSENSKNMFRCICGKSIYIAGRLLDKLSGFFTRRYSEALLKYIDSIDWQKDGSETPGTNRFADKSAAKVYEAISFIKSEIDDLLRERDAADKILRESEKKYRSLVEYSADHIFMLDLNGTYITSNDQVSAFDFPDGESLVGKSLKDVYKSELLGLYQSKVDELIETEKPIYFQHKLKESSGMAYHMDTLYPVYRDNNLWAIGGICRDITEEKRLEKEQQKLQEKIQQSQKMEAIGTLAGGIAHDFNNILSSVIGFTELALDDATKGTPLEDSLQEVYAAGKRAKDLVKQILAFARQSEGQNKPIQPSIIAKEVINFIRSSIPTTIEIKQEINSDSLIMGNTTEVHQILMNLCTNAAHAMEAEGGILDVRLKDITVGETSKKEKLDLEFGDYIELKITDTGTGISPEIIDSIFEPYFTTKGLGEGTGMGLAMVHGIIESYAGKITVASTPDKGTVFSIYLPITKKRGTGQQYVDEDLPSGTERILFVDDELAIAKMGSQILERLGYQVTVRTSSIEALELFRAKPDDFDLIITDMTMPNMTGDNLAIEMMRIRPNLPVIICTGYSKKISDEIAGEIGIKGFAYKPVVKSDLAEAVRKVLDKAKKKT